VKLAKARSWSQLVGEWIEIWQAGQHLRSGLVVDAMPDSSALWLAADGVNPRKAFEKSEGHEAWLEWGRHGGEESFPFSP